MTDPFDIPADWYRDFFHAPANRFWERVVPPEATLSDIAFLTRHLAAPRARILDVACGAGRHALALARAGYDVTGIDISADAIERARAAANRLSARFILADMRDLPASERFDGAICMGNGFGYLDHEGTTVLLARLADTLVPGARLVIDSHTAAESLLPRLAPDHPEDFPGGTYDAQRRYDPATSTLKTVATLTIDGARHRLRYAHRVMTSGEMLRLLGDAGFDAVGLFSNTDDAEFAVGCPRLLLVAQRNAQALRPREG